MNISFDKQVYLWTNLTLFSLAIAALLPPYAMVPVLLAVVGKALLDSHRRWFGEEVY